MPLAYPCLEKDSPNLSGKIHRKFRCIPNDCRKAYYLASELGGNIEPDFVREEGVSFNPRAARVGVILIEGIHQISIEQLALGILSTVLSRVESFDLSQISFHLSEHYKKKFLALYDYFHYLKNNSIHEVPLYKGQCVTEFAPILLALFLDDMRHVHLAPLELREKKTGDYLKRARIYEAVSKIHMPYYTPFIQRWINRNNKRPGKQ